MALGEGVGTRVEVNDFTYLEVGFVSQRSYNVLSDVSVGQTSCQLNSSNSLSTCAGMLPAVMGVNLTPSYSTYNQKGGYMLASWTQEFPKNPFRSGYPVSSLKKALFLYQGTAFGNFFAYGSASTSSALTRYAFALNNTLQIQLPANFTFGPSYNLFWFQANQHGLGSSLHRSSINAQLNYFLRLAQWHVEKQIDHRQGSIIEYFRIGVSLGAIRDFPNISPHAALLFYLDRSFQNPHLVEQPDRADPALDSAGLSEDDFRGLLRQRDSPARGARGGW